MVGSRFAVPFSPAGDSKRTDESAVEKTMVVPRTSVERFACHTEARGGSCSAVVQSTARFQKFDVDKWARTLGDLNFQRASGSEHKQLLGSSRPSIWTVGNWSCEKWPSMAVKVTLVGHGGYNVPAWKTWWLLSESASRRLEASGDSSPWPTYSIDQHTTCYGIILASHTWGCVM